MAKSRELLGVLIMVFGFFSLAQGSLQEVYQAGIEAYKKGNYEDFASNMEKANEYRPNHPTILYNLATAYALTDKKEAAVEALGKALRMNAEMTFESDEDLASLKGYAPFEDLKEQINALKEPLSNGSIAFTLMDKSLHPEGVTYSQKQKKFYVGGVRTQKITSIGRNGKVSELFSSGEKLMAIMGLQVDDKRNLLWVCSTPAPEMVEYEEGLVAEVLSFDLESGQLVGSYVAPHREAWLGDLLVSDEGVVYVTSSSAEKPAIYVVNEETKKLDVLLEPKDLVSLQGLSLNADQSALFFSDYRYGLFKYDLSSEQLTKLKADIDHSIKGIDGLYYYKGDLIAIHNGLRPFRIVRYKLNSTEDQILGYTFLEKALPEMNEPTLGTIVNDRFYYVANSPWGAYDKDKQLKLNEVENPQVRMVKLK